MNNMWLKGSVLPFLGNSRWQPLSSVEAGERFLSYGEDVFNAGLFQHYFEEAKVILQRSVASPS